MEDHRDAAKEVGPTLFYALLVITVSFAPVFTLQAQEGRLFKPLAFTKTYAMAASSLLAITLVPVLMGFCIRGRLRPEEKNPLSRIFIKIYESHSTLCTAMEMVGRDPGRRHLGPDRRAYRRDRLPSSCRRSGRETSFICPPRFPGSPSPRRANSSSRRTDHPSVSEVRHVFGKVRKGGYRDRSGSALDDRDHDHAEATVGVAARDDAGQAHARAQSGDSIPGLTNAWTMPIKTRIDMLSTGIKTPVGIKVSGPDLGTLQQIGEEVEAVIGRVPGTLSVFSERVMGGNYLIFGPNRDEIARYGLTVGDVQDVIQSAIGG